MHGKEIIMKIEFSRISKRYKDKYALKEVSFEMENGIYGLLGTNGAGKTTLINIFMGILKSDGGSILIDGTDTKKIGVDFLSQIGYLPQSTQFYRNFTVLEFMKYMCVLKDISKKDGIRRTEELLHMVNLDDSKNKKIGALSGGMKQRVAIARAYAVNPSVLLMDEPFGALDAQTRTQLQTELLETWQKEKKTCFFITHDVDEAIVLAQKVIIMSARPGRIKEIVDINIPYPRTQETKLTKEFLDLKDHIWRQVYKEYLEVRK